MGVVLRCFVFLSALGCAMAVNLKIGVMNLGHTSSDFDQAMSTIRESGAFPKSLQLSVVEKIIDAADNNLTSLTADMAEFLDEDVCATVLLDCWDDHCPDSSFILRALPQPIIRVGPPVSKDHNKQPDINILEIHPSANQMAKMLHQTIQTFNWRSLTVFFHKSGGYHGVFEQLMSLMSYSNVYYRVAEIPNDPTARHVQLESFLKSSKNRKEKRFLIIADAYATNEVLHYALHHLMLDPRYHWILTTLEENGLQVYHHRNTGVRITLFRLRTHETAYSKFVNFSNENQTNTLQAAMTFDAALAVWHATRLLAEEEDICDQIGSAVYKVGFNGRSGMVAFGQQGTRVKFSIEIMELSFEGRPEHIGEWNEREGVTLEKWTKLTGIQSTDPILGGAELKILGREKNPWLIVKGCKSGEVCSRKKLKGFLPDLMDHLKKRLGFTWVMNLTKDSMGEKVKGEWKGLTGALVRGEADTVLYGATTRSRRTEVLEYSFPIAHQGYYIIIQRPDSSLNIMDLAGLFEFLAPFDIWVWAAIGAGLLAVTVSLFVINWLNPFEWHQLAQRGVVDKEEGNHFNLVQSAWFTYGCLVGQGGENLPKSTAGRVVAGTWWFFVLVTVASYTANLAAFLGRANRVYAVQTPEQLVADRLMPYGTYEGYTLLKFLQNTSLPPFRAMGKYMQEHSDTSILKSKDEGLRRASEGNFAFIGEPNYGYVLQNKWCNLTLGSAPFFKSMIALPFPAGSPFIEPINRALMELQDEGIMDNLRSKWLEKTGKCMEHTKSDGVLRINNFKGVFIVLLLGITAGAIVGLFECFGHQCRKCIKKVCGEDSKNSEENGTELRMETDI
ncbi:glutamate receptor ionotropic, kainate 2-like [Branchiostoma floridae]|uniref:Glutamate receptor ionotropic, kainate 2-like n=1 Tax=Branchiostoma floridae TaxID=7739 RepID=A0A9J7LSA2_BRAFL|nr:glutamate receptor ionotropic, kainate 2-like [Branchiostoma floridae]